ncbi:MAG: radical SAM protein [Desulfuromonadaceae bacterium]|nr:radical SAM protein [Desulfuromonadaceae bacterium]
MLITLVSIHPYPSPQSIPLAAAFLKAYARTSDVPINLADFFLGDSPSACASIVAASDPTAAGFSMYVWNRDLCCKVAAEIRRCNPSTLLFCGGPEVTADPKSIIDLGVFDFIIVGEGEIPFLFVSQALLRGDDISGIPGIMVPGSPLIPPPSPVSDMDSIPSPYLTGIIDVRTYPGILWQLSRGCSFTCDFCFDSRGIHGVRHFSLERVESELRHFAATGIQQIFVLDSTFNVNPERAKTILRMIRKIAPDIHFHFEVRNEFIDREMARLFSQIACSLQIGLQSADKGVLKMVGRSFNMADFTTKVGLLNESGAVFGFDLIYGLPGDSLDVFCRSLNYALSLYPNHLDIFPLAVLPGTKLALQGKQLGLCWNPSPPYVLTSTASFSCADMTAAGDLAAACDIFYTRGKAVAWFNAVAESLRMKPAEILQTFSLWLNNEFGRRIIESDVTDEEIGAMQQRFLKHLLHAKKAKKYLPLILDLQNYHYQYAAVLLAPGPEASARIRTPANPCESSFRLSPSARLASFTYEIEELLECGEPRIAWMYEHLQKSGSQAVLYSHKGVVCTESLAPPYMILLGQIRDRADRINVSDSGLTHSEATEFLIFALQEGIIEPA